MAEKVIVYRSLIEQRADEYWANNPEMIVYFIGAVFVGVGLLYAYGWLKNRFFKNKRLKRGRWS